MENMLLTCCSSASFVSKGNFTRFCLRFVEKFDVKQADWKPQKRDGILMNSCMLFSLRYITCDHSQIARYYLEASLIDLEMALIKVS